MNTLFDCELDFTPNFHLMQLYTGFYALQKKGLLNLKINFKKSNSNTLAVTTAIINKKYKVIYDALDGFTWIHGTKNENLSFFQNNYKADFYFKRSYNSEVLQYSPQGCKIFPLGLNYNVQPDAFLFSLNNSVRDKIEYLLKRNKLTSKILNKRFYYTKDFEYYPLKPKVNKLLFITRLWDPEDGKSEHSKHFRETLNETRVQCIKACKKEYGNIFTGGLFNENFANKNYHSLVMPYRLTNKKNYLQSIKDHNICITTTGLHNSIGWKLAEYVAASRAILTEPLKFELPGNFSANNNYLAFRNADELLHQINLLLTNKHSILQMMHSNYSYYNNYLKPENLVMNTLLTIINNEERKVALKNDAAEKILL